MDSKFYVSLEAARLLKEKGYNEPTEYLHSDDIIYKGICLNYLKTKLCGGMKVEDNVSYPCPTKAEAIDWLDTKEIVVEISSVRNRKWRFSIYKNGWFQIDSWIHDKLDFSTRLEAEEAAIIKALELL